MQANILIIDDDPSWVGSLKLYLSRMGYACAVAASGREGLHLLIETQPDIILLDLMMPDMDGWTVCDRVRDLADVPIIVLSGLSEQEHRVSALDRGADDYMTKPIALREMVARMEAVMRRHRGPRQVAESTILVDQDLSIDTDHWQVRLKGELIEMTPAEMRFLVYLARNPNRVLTHREILTHVWGADAADDLNYTKLFAWRIRSKIEEDVTNPKYLITEPGVGYRFCAIG